MPSALGLGAWCWPVCFSMSWKPQFPRHGKSCMVSGRFPLSQWTYHHFLRFLLMCYWLALTLLVKQCCDVGLWPSMMTAALFVWKTLKNNIKNNNKYYISWCMQRRKKQLKMALVANCTSSHQMQLRATTPATQTMCPIELFKMLAEIAWNCCGYTSWGTGCKIVCPHVPTVFCQIWGDWST